MCLNARNYDMKKLEISHEFCSFYKTLQIMGQYINGKF